MTRGTVGRFVRKELTNTEIDTVRRFSAKKAKNRTSQLQSPHSLPVVSPHKLTGNFSPTPIQSKHLSSTFTKQGGLTYAKLHDIGIIGPADDQVYENDRYPG